VHAETRLLPLLAGDLPHSSKYATALTLAAKSSLQPYYLIMMVAIVKIPLLETRLAHAVLPLKFKPLSSSLSVTLPSTPADASPMLLEELPATVIQRSSTIPSLVSLQLLKIASALLPPLIKLRELAIAAFLTHSISSSDRVALLALIPQHADARELPPLTPLMQVSPAIAQIDSSSTRLPQGSL